MAKKRKKKTSKAANIFKYFVIGILVLSLALLAGQAAIKAAYHANMFKVKDVACAPSLQFISSSYLDRVRGKSIFAVDLDKLKNRLQARYPEIDQLRVLRRFPDKIYIVARKREPFAYVTLSQRIVLLDEEGIVISFEDSPKQRLPHIHGVTVPRKAIVGKPLRRKEVDVAVDIIQSVHDTDDLTSYEVDVINVSNLSKIDFQFSNGLNVIIDRDKIEQKIKKLGILLSQGNLTISNVNYVDLRFKEPILGQK